jgi:indole-3-glycerol phosphate synthase
MDILTEIFTYKKEAVAVRKKSAPLAEVRRQAEGSSAPADLVQALWKVRPSPALIAEVKFHSPSKGTLTRRVDPVGLASKYVQGEAAAISVLTDEKYFHGHLDHLRQIHAAYPYVPLMRKDFIFDPYQVYEARAAGASAILLITASLDLSLLQELHALALDLGLAALVEVHDEGEMEITLRVPNLRLVGVNNRDLRTFQTDLGTCIRLRPLAPPEVCFVAESGIHHYKDIHRLRKAGVNAILVGEALVTAADPGERIREMFGAGVEVT